MFEILSKAGCFIAIIILGYVLRKKGFFKEEDFGVLSKIVLKITLPAAIVTSFSGKEINPALLLLALIGLGGGILYLTLGFILYKRRGRDVQAFVMLNSSGYNIGNFTLPFVQSFLGTTGVIATSLFDVGNAFICLGGAYSISSIVKGGGKFSIKKILKALTKSVAFDCYILMLVLNLLNINLPSPVLSFAEIISGANAFIAMLMIGVGFKLSGDRSQMGMIVKILAVRYGVALLLALLCFNFLPFDLEIRQAIVILFFSPIASAAPAFTADMKGDFGLASAISSISIVCSIVLIVICLVVVL